MTLTLTVGRRYSIVLGVEKKWGGGIDCTFDRSASWPNARPSTLPTDVARGMYTPGRCPCKAYSSGPPHQFLAISYQGMPLRLNAHAPHTTFEQNLGADGLRDTQGVWGYPGDNEWDGHLYSRGAPLSLGCHAARVHYPPPALPRPAYSLHCLSGPLMHVVHNVTGLSRTPPPYSHALLVGRCLGSSELGVHTGQRSS